MLPDLHRGRRSFPDCSIGCIQAVTPDGAAENVAAFSAFPMCIDSLPDGRLLAVHGAELREQRGRDLIRSADCPAGVLFAFLAFNIPTGGDLGEAPPVGADPGPSHRRHLPGADDSL